ncbi:MAG: hypothetical protein MHM6MM_004209, partial [Cercozoa sp. M6MM]
MHRRVLTRSVRVAARGVGQKVRDPLLRPVPALDPSVARNDGRFFQPVVDAEVSQVGTDATEATEVATKATEVATEVTEVATSAATVKDRQDEELVPLSDESYGLHAHVQQRLAQMGVRHATRIQHLAFQHMARHHSGDSEHDGFGCVVLGAETGSGKTLAFAAPLVSRLLSDDDVVLRNSDSLSELAQLASQRRWTRAFVLCPSAELVRQTTQVLRTLCGQSHLSVFGVETAERWPYSRHTELFERLPKKEDGSLRHGIAVDRVPDIVVATAKAAEFNLTKDMALHTKVVVADECDVLVKWNQGQLRRMRRVLATFHHVSKDIRISFDTSPLRHYGRPVFVFAGATLGSKVVQRYLGKDGTRKPSDHFGPMEK